MQKERILELINKGIDTEIKEIEKEISKVQKKIKRNEESTNRALWEMAIVGYEDKMKGLIEEKDKIEERLNIGLS